MSDLEVAICGLKIDLQNLEVANYPLQETGESIPVTKKKSIRASLVFRGGLPGETLV
jgi:hypothetical protein